MLLCSWIRYIVDIIDINDKSNSTSKQHKIPLINELPPDSARIKTKEYKAKNPSKEMTTENIINLYRSILNNSTSKVRVSNLHKTKSVQGQINEQTEENKITVDACLKLGIVNYIKPIQTQLLDYNIMHNLSLGIISVKLHVENKLQYLTFSVYKSLSNCDIMIGKNSKSK